MPSKAWWKSKTIWFNIAILASGVVDFILASRAQGGGVIALGILGIILRFITNRPINGGGNTAT